MLMPKSQNHDQVPVEPDVVSGDDINTLEIEGDEASTENLSEVAQRINLLGKLVIPPSNP